MAMRAKYIHTNLVAKDWRRLADFYQTVFGCVPVPPERDFEGKELEKRAQAFRARAFKDCI